jgi:ABC-type dipeptide/oligopeptide/nickel transport system permease component
LSISSALQAITDLYKVNKTELMVESIKEIELRKLPHYEQYWHYLVKVKSNDLEKVKYQVYVVLMNGKVIPALLETESYK